MVALPSIVEVAAILARAPRDQPWRNEAPCRHLIRRMILFDGRQSWRKADRAAHRIVAKARIQNGTRQPAGWDSPWDLASWFAVGECELCGHRFKPTHPSHFYCSAACNNRAKKVRAERTLLRRCSRCSELFESHGHLKKFCSVACRKAAECGRNKAERLATKELLARVCECCGKPLPVTMWAQAKYCDDKCGRAARSRRETANGLNGANGHVQHHGAGAPANGRGSPAGDRPGPPGDPRGAGSREVGAGDGA